MPFDDTSQNFQAAASGYTSPFVSAAPPPLISCVTPPLVGTGGFTMLTCAFPLKNHQGEKYSCTKTFEPTDDGLWRLVSSYDAGSLVRLKEFRFTTHEGFLAAAMEVAATPLSYLVMGQMTPEARARPPGTDFRRLKVGSGLVTDVWIAVFMTAAWRSLVIDFENIDLEEGYDSIQDAIRAIKWAIKKHLPKHFQNVRCAFHLSSSMGFIGPRRLKVHLLYWMDRAIDIEVVNKIIKQIAPDNKQIDKCVLAVSQPLWVNPPEIKGGLPDPIANRWGWIEWGDDQQRELVLPDLEPDAPKLPRQRGGGAGGGAKPNPTGANYASLQDAFDRFGEGEGLSNFYEPSRDASWRYAIECQRGDRDRDDATYIASVINVIYKAPRTRSANGEDFLKYTRPRYHQDKIDSAFAKLDKQQGPVNPAPETGPVTDVETGRLAIRKAMHAAVTAAKLWLPGDPENPPPHVLIKGETGSSKSQSFIEEAGPYISDRKAAEKAPRIWDWVPTHELSGGIRDRYTDIGVNAGIYYGRDYEDPETETTMCLRPEVPKAISEMKLSVGKYACGDGEPPERACPDKARCPYQLQKPALQQADVVILANALLIHDPDILGIGKNFGLSFIDETFIEAGLDSGIEIKMANFVDSLTAYPPMKSQTTPDGTTIKIVDTEAQAELRAIHSMMVEAYDRLQEHDLLPYDAMINGYKTAQTYQKAALLQWSRLVTPPDLHAGLPLAEIKKRGKPAAGNAMIEKHVMLMQALGELRPGQTATGRVQIGKKDDGFGNRGTLLLNIRRDISKKISSLPIIYGDATPPPEAILKLYLPNIVTGADVSIDAPHMDIIQITGAWGKQKLVPDPQNSAAKNAECMAKVSEMHDFITSRFRGGAALLITYKGIAQYFRDIPGLLVNHHGNISGLDCYKHVRWVFIFGQPTARDTANATAARTLDGQPYTACEAEWIDQQLNMRDGSLRSISTPRYAEPMREAMRWLTGTAAVIQEVGRPRGVNRLANDPVTVYLMSNLVIPQQIAALTDWDSIAPNRIERMASRGLLLTTPSDAAAIYGGGAPDNLFKDAEAARWALSGVNSLRPYGDAVQALKVEGYYSTLSACTGSPYVGNELTAKPWFCLFPVSYRAKGKRLATAFVSPARATGLADWLAEKLGAPLAEYRIDDELTYIKILPAADPIPDGWEAV